MNYVVRLTDAAKGDLIEIFRYIAVNLRSTQNAQRQLARLKEAIASLNQMPERFRVYRKGDTQTLRIMPVDHYVVFYTACQADHSVQVIRVLYGGRDIERILSQEI